MSTAAQEPWPAPVILVVDDEDVVRRLMVRTLLQGGYDVLEARNGAEAITILTAKAHTTQLVVSDIAMPGMTGIELAGLVASTWPTLPLLLVSGQTRPPDEYRGGFLPKPFAPDALLAAVASLVPHGTV